MEYVVITEPRLTGKTSLIFQLRARLVDEGYIVAYLDAESLNREDEQSWYAGLWNRLRLQLGSLPEVEQLTAPGTYTEWRGLLRNLASQAQKVGTRLVIAIDELGALLPRWAEPFFRVLRELYNARAVEPTLGHLSFILAGPFEPRQLIQDERVSPFNIAQRVELSDFDEAQVEQLVAYLGRSAEETVTIAKRVRYWTAGQPYLTQKLCAYLAEESVPITQESVDRAAIRFRSEDTMYLPRILQRLGEDPQAMNFLRKIGRGERIPFGRSNPLHSRLYLTGALDVDEKGECRIRNYIVQEALVMLEQSKAIPLEDETRLIIKEPEAAGEEAVQVTVSTRHPIAIAVALLGILAGIVSIISAVSSNLGGLAMAAGLVGLMLIGFALYVGRAR